MHELPSLIVQTSVSREYPLQHNVQKMQSWLDFHDFTRDDLPTDKDGALLPGYQNLADLKIFVEECFLFNLDYFVSGKPLIKPLPFDLQEKTGNQKVQMYMCKKCGKLEVKIDMGYPSRLGYCPACKREHDKELLKVRRARKSGKELRFCEQCGKLLRDDHPNRKYCSGACRTRACRLREILNPDGSLTLRMPIPKDPEIAEYIIRRMVEKNVKWELEIQ